MGGHWDSWKVRHRNHWGVSSSLAEGSHKLRWFSRNSRFGFPNRGDSPIRNLERINANMVTVRIGFESGLTLTY